MKNLIKNASLFKKGLSENDITFGFENLIPRRYLAWSSGATLGDKPAQGYYPASCLRNP